MSFEQVQWVNWLLVIVVLVVVRWVCRKVSYLNIVSTSNKEDTAALVYLKGAGYLLYSAEKYDIEEDYNWHKIQADQKKGVPKELAVLREKVIALQMLQYKYESIKKVEITWRDPENPERNLMVDLDKYTTWVEEKLIEMEEAYIMLKDFNALMTTLEEMGWDNEEDNDENL